MSAESSPHLYFAQGSLLQDLTRRNKLLLFSYSPERELMLSITGNVQELLGLPEPAIMTGANLFLRHMYEADRFVLLDKFEAALQGESAFFTSYRWLRPDNKQLLRILCRGELRQDEHDSLSFDGFLLDITALPFDAAEFSSQSSSLLGLVPHPALFIDRDYWILAHNLEQRPLGYFQFTLAGRELQSDELHIGKNLVDHREDPDLAEERKKIFASLFDETRLSYTERFVQNGVTQETEILPFPTASGQILGLVLSVRDVSHEAELERRAELLLASEQRHRIAASISQRLRNVLQSALGQLSLSPREGHSQAEGSAFHDALQRSIGEASLLSEKILEQHELVQEEEFSSDVNLACMTALSKLDSFFSRGVKIALNFGSPPKMRISEESFVSSLVRIVETLFAQCEDHMQMSLSTGHRLPVGKELGKAQRASPEHSHHAQVHIVVKARRTHLRGRKKQGQEQISFSLSHLTSAFQDAHIEFVEHGSRSNEQGSVYSFSLMIPALFQEERSENKPSPHHAPLVLVVDDDPLVRETAVKSIEKAGYPCVSAPDSASAMMLAKQCAESLRVVLLDIFLPGEDGRVVLQMLKLKFPSLRIIGFTGAGEEARQSFLRQGADAVLKKPMEIPRILECIEKFLPPKKAA